MRKGGSSKIDRILEVLGEELVEDEIKELDETSERMKKVI